MTNPPHRPSRPIPVRPSGALRAIDQDEVEKQAALRDVMEHAVRQTRAVQMAKPMVSVRARPIGLTVAAVLSVLLSVYSHVARPDWVYGPDPAAMPTEQRDAGIRFGMYLLAQRLEQYRSERGRLPPNLDYLDQTWRGIAYSPITDSTFELRASAGGTAIVFRSEEPVGRFLGGSINIVRRRR